MIRTITKHSTILKNDLECCAVLLNIQDYSSNFTYSYIHMIALQVKKETFFMDGI